MNCARGFGARESRGRHTLRQVRCCPSQDWPLRLLSSRIRPLFGVQLTMPQPSAPETQSAPTKQRALGAGTQLQTGTSSGLDTDARLLGLLADHQYSRAEAQLGQLPPGQAQFYRGVLVNLAVADDEGNSFNHIDRMGRESSIHVWRRASIKTGTSDDALQRAGGLKQGLENREQRTENREQRTENREQL